MSHSLLPLKMRPITIDPSLLSSLADKTAIITGAANGIGAETARLFNTHGANVVIADLERTRSTAETLIASMVDPSRAMFVPTNTIEWNQMTHLFRSTVDKFGSVDMMVANAGVMESNPVLDSEDLVDEEGELKESVEAFKVIDINLKGTLNTLRLALHHMKPNHPNRLAGGSRGSIVLVSSTSGYFGGTGVTAYVASKHGITGLLRSSQLAANAANIRVNAVAPSFTPTQITAGFGGKWRDAGIEANTPQNVAAAIAQTIMDPAMRGNCCLVCFHFVLHILFECL